MRIKSKRILLGIFCIVALFTLLFTINVKAEGNESWGPVDRPTYTWENRAEFPTFNSITDNPDIGDERNFVRVRMADTDEKFRDEVEIIPGAEYEVYIYFHNNADPQFNSKENERKGVATKTTASSTYTEKVEKGKRAIIHGEIGFNSNGERQEIWDSAFLNNEKGTVLLRYVPNSIIIHAQGDADGEKLSPEQLFSSEGLPLAYSKKAWGMIPAGNDYAGYLTYRLKAEYADFIMQTLVARVGTENFDSSISAQPGDILDVKVSYKNIGTTIQDKVAVFEELPKGLTYIKGSTKMRNSTYPEYTSINDGIFDGGMGIGSYSSGQYADIIYKVKVDDDLNAGEETVLYTNASVSTINGTGHDRVQITVGRAIGGNKPTWHFSKMNVALFVAAGILLILAFRIKVKK